MTLTLAVYVNILNHCAMEDVVREELLSALISTVEADETFTTGDRTVERVFSGERGFPKSQGRKGCGEPKNASASTNIVPLIAPYRPGGTSFIMKLSLSCSSATISIRTGSCGICGAS